MIWQSKRDNLVVLISRTGSRDALSWCILVITFRKIEFQSLWFFNIVMILTHVVCFYFDNDFDSWKCWQTIACMASCFWTSKSLIRTLINWSSVGLPSPHRLILCSILISIPDFKVSSIPWYCQLYFWGVRWDQILISIQVASAN